ncbi:MAG: hypothetical protein PHE43_00670 [Candidatus Nanoarchaeia archaeon]|nr:hypothetical protein [Candidatus Nanoarchaeia archaeon]
MIELERKMSSKSIKKLREERIKLIRDIQSCKNYKEKILKYVYKTKKDHDNNLISPSQYYNLLNKKLQGKSPTIWINYYDNLIEDYSKKLKHCEERIGAEKLSTKNNGLIITIAMIAMVLGAGLFFESNITGFFTAEETNLSDMTSEIVNETQEIIEEIPAEIINETETLVQEPIADIISSEEFVDGIVEINKPVKWIKKITLNEFTENLTVVLPSDAENIKVNKILEENKESVKEDKLKTEEGLVNTFSGEVQEKNLIIEDSVKDLEIEYYVSGPRSVETEINKYNKEIKIESKIPYDTIKMSSNVPGVTHEGKNILVQTKDNILLDDTNYIDTDSDGLIDRIEWLASSNETFETEIVFLTVKESYSKDNSWIIKLKTIGTADLRISPVNNLEIKCSGQVINYEIIENSVIVKDYYCDSETEVIAPMDNNLLFEFGDKSELAYKPVLGPGIIGGSSPSAELNIETVQEDEYIYTDVEAINETTLKITVYPKVLDIPESYRWSIGICGNEIDSIEYKEAKEKDRINAFETKEVNKNKMKDDWCSDYDGVGYLIEEDNTKYDLPKKYNLYIDNLKTSKFNIFVGGGTDVKVGDWNVAASGRSYNKMLVKDSLGTLHGLWRDSGSDIQYTNSTDNGLTWTSKEILAGTSGYYSLLINSTDGLIAIWDETSAYNIYWSESPNYGVTWKTAAVIPVLDFNSTARLSVGQAAVMDLNDNVHICTTTQQWNSSTSENFLFYANRSAATGAWSVVDVNLATSDDTDTCDIAVDTNGVVYIAASGSTGADVEVWTSANGWGDTKDIMVHSSTGDTVPSIDIDKNNNIVISWEEFSNDLGFANSTPAQATTAWTNYTVDLGNSNHPDIKISDNGDVYILYVDSTAGDFDILSSFWNITTGTWTARTVQQNNTWGTNVSYPSMRGSLIGKDIVTSQIDYLYWNTSDACYYFNWFNVTPNLAVSVTPSLELESSSLTPGDSTLLNANCTPSGGTLHDVAIMLYTNQTDIDVIIPTTEGANKVYANESWKNLTDLTTVETMWFNVTGVTAGSYSLTIECNGTESWTNATTILTVAAGANTAPTFEDLANYSKNEDNADWTDTFTANVSDAEDPDASLVYTAVVNDTDILNITFVNATGIATYVVVGNMSGIVDIDWTVYDTGGLTATSSQTITLDAVNDAPWATREIGLANITTNEDAGTLNNVILNSDILLNWTDVEDASPTSYEIMKQTNTSTSCYFDGSNNFDCTTNANQSGIDYYTLSINDSAGLSVIYDWQIVVSEVNDIPTIIDISNIPTQSITEGSVNEVEFTFTAYDADGVAQLNDNSVNATFFMEAEELRTNLSCNLVSDLDTITANYSCTIGVWYWDKAGDWSVNVSIIDTNNAQSADYNETFTLQETTAMVMGPTILGWETLNLGNTNQLSNADPIMINNTGNKDIASGNVRVKAFDLVGENNGGYYIPAANFSINVADACEGTLMVNNTATGITSSIITAGNNTNGDGQENLYACLEDVPANIMPQSYSVVTDQSWVIDVT